VTPMLQAQRVEELRGSCAGFVTWHAIDIAGEQEVLFDGEIVKQSEIFRQYADAMLQLERRGGGVQTADADLAACGWEQAGHHFHGGGLSRPIGSQESADRAGSNFQIQPVDRSEFPEAARQIAARDHTSIVRAEVAKRHGRVLWYTAAVVFGD